VFTGEVLSDEEYKRQIYEGSTPDPKLNRKYRERYIGINAMIEEFKPSKKEIETDSGKLMDELLAGETIRINSPTGTFISKPKKEVDEK